MRLPPRDLRRRLPRRPASRDRAPVTVELARKPKLPQRYARAVAVRREEQSLRLEVAVDDALPTEVRDHRVCPSKHPSEAYAFLRGVGGGGGRARPQMQPMGQQGPSDRPDPTATAAATSRARVIPPP